MAGNLKRCSLGGTLVNFEYRRCCRCWRSSRFGSYSVFERGSLRPGLSGVTDKYWVWRTLMTTPLFTGGCLPNKRDTIYELERRWVDVEGTVSWWRWPSASRKPIQTNHFIFWFNLVRPYRYVRRSACMGVRVLLSVPSRARTILDMLRKPCRNMISDFNQFQFLKYPCMRRSVFQATYIFEQLSYEWYALAIISNHFWSTHSTKQTQARRFTAVCWASDAATVMSNIEVSTG